MAHLFVCMFVCSASSNDKDLQDFMNLAGKVSRRSDDVGGGEHLFSVQWNLRVTNCSVIQTSYNIW